MIRVVLAIYSLGMFAVGMTMLVAASSTGVEYAGGAALVGGAIAGVYGLLRKLSSDTTVSHSYQELINGLQRDNERLRSRLRECEEREVERDEDYSPDR